MKNIGADLFKLACEISRAHPQLSNAIDFPSDFAPPPQEPLSEEDLESLYQEWKGRELDAELAEKQAMKDEPPQ